MTKKNNFSRVLILLLLFLHFNCSQKKESGNEKEPEVKEKVTSVPKDTVVKVKKVHPGQAVKNTAPDASCEPCVKILDKLVKTSDFNTSFKRRIGYDYSIVINEATQEKVTIQIVLLNEDKSTVPMGWLELDLENGKLFDVTNDPEAPLLMKFDQSLLDEFKAKCMQCCTD